MGEVFRRAPLRRHDFEPEFLEPRANGGVVERLAHRLVELAHDRLGRAFRKEKRVPDACLDAGQTLLAGRGDLGNDRHPLLCHDGDRFDRALLGLRRAALDGGAHVIDAPADEVLH